MGPELCSELERGWSRGLLANNRQPVFSRPRRPGEPARLAGALVEFAWPKTCLGRKRKAPTREEWALLRPGWAPKKSVENQAGVALAAAVAALTALVRRDLLRAAVLRWITPF